MTRFDAADREATDVERVFRVEYGQAVAATDTSVTDVFGVGPIVAAFLIGYTGDPLRFASTLTRVPGARPP